MPRWSAPLIVKSHHRRAEPQYAQWLESETYAVTAAVVCSASLILPKRSIHVAISSCPVESHANSEPYGKGILSHTPIRFSMNVCISRASLTHPSRYRSVRSSSKTEPTISPHCAVPVPFPCFFVHGSPPWVHRAIAVLCARRRYHCHGCRLVSGGECQRPRR